MRSYPLPWMGFALVMLVLSPLDAAWGQNTSELRAGRWVEVASPTTQESIDPALVAVEQLIRNGKSSDAMKAAVAWLKSNKGSPNYDRGLYLMAEALYQYGDRIKAFYYLDQLLDEHQESPLFYQAQEKQYQIADEFLNGYKRRVLKMPFLTAKEEAIEMLFRIQQRSPKSMLAEKALLRTADHYYANADYDLAEDAYRSYKESYPRSPYTPRVMLREAYSNLAQFRGLKFDATPVIDAKIQLQDIIVKYPDLAAEESIPSVVERIDNTFARKLYTTADFYRRTHEPRAAAYTYNALVRNYPNTPEAERARRELQKLGAAPTSAPAAQ